MILFVLEPHRALYFSGGVDETAERIARKRVVVAARLHVFELGSLVITALGVRSFEEKAFDFVGGVERVSLLLEKLVGVVLEDAANIGAVRSASLIDDLAEDKHLAIAEHIGGRPVECAPVDAEAKIAFALRGEAANRGAVEGQIVVALQQKLFVVVEHVQAAFEVAEEHSDGLNALFIGEIFEALFLDLVRSGAVPALLLRLQVHFFQFVVRECQEIAQFSRNDLVSVSFVIESRFGKSYVEMLS